MDSRRRNNRHVIYLYLTVLCPGLMGGRERGEDNDHAAGIIEPLLDRLRIEDGGSMSSASLPPIRSGGGREGTAIPTTVSIAG